MIVIAERINSSRKDIARALRERDAGFIRNEAKTQADAGADYIDVNAGSFHESEADLLAWLVREVEAACDGSICLDSPDPDVIRAVLPHVHRPVIVNSISLEPGRAEGMLALVKEREAGVIALCQAPGKPGRTAVEKVELARRLIDMTTSWHIPINSVFIDPLLYPIGTDHRSAMETLDAIEEIAFEFPGVNTVCGLTNISYGLPERRLINRTFLVAALVRGLSAVIMDPTDKNLYAALKAGLAVAGRDELCMGYITSFRQGRLQEQLSTPAKLDPQAGAPATPHKKDDPLKSQD